MSLLVPIFLAGCSADEVKDPTDFLQNPDGAEETVDDPENQSESPGDSNNGEGHGIHFLTTITNYFGRDLGTSTYRSASLAGKWEHEYDKADRLLKSTFYEEYPSRIIKEIYYSEYSEDNLEMDLEIKTFTYFLGIQMNSLMKYRLILHDDFSADKVLVEAGDAYLGFEELTSNGFVTKLSETLVSGRILSVINYEYDDNGNHTKYYSPYSNTGASVDYSYTELGDLKTYDFQNEEGSFSNTEYFYRADNTLERLEETFYTDEDYAGTKLFLYDEMEAFEKKLINFNDGSKIIESYEEDQIIEQHYRPGEILKEVWKYRIVENYIYCEMIEYYDENGNLDYTEYYDENGDLVDTVYE